jgi:putative transposase
VVQHVVLTTKAALSTQFLASISQMEAVERRRVVDLALDFSSVGNVFSDPVCALAFESQLLHFDKLRYDLLAWCVMPNHIHIVLCAYLCATIGQIVRSWKVLSTATINRHYNSKGTIFTCDYFDRYMRNGVQTERTIAYVENNPAAAGLCAEIHNWRYSSAWHKASGWQARTDRLPVSLPKN